jgi:hypothetical protein
MTDPERRFRFSPSHAAGYGTRQALTGLLRPEL